MRTRQTISKSTHYPIIDPVFYVLVATSILCAWMVAYREAQAINFVQYRFLLWNLFLAWLPVLFSMASLLFHRVLNGRPRYIALALCGLAWLLLYPNAPYLTTDLVHLIFNSVYLISGKNGMLVWYDLVLIVLFSWCGLLLGYVSMRQIHALIRQYFDKWIGWLFVVAAAYLGGYGIYLGRVMRLNSWDAVFSPFRMIESVLEGMNWMSFQFTGLFGTLILIVYLSLYTLGRTVYSEIQTK